MTDKDGSENRLRLVSKANDLVEAKYRLTIQEQKLIIMAISKINPMSPEFENPYRLSVDEVAEACGLEKTGVYQKVAATVDKLMTRLVKLKEDDGHRVVHWVSEAKYYTGMGHFDLWFHEKMKPYLLDLKEYVSYDRRAVLQFQSQYSFRIYEILKKWQGSNKQNQFSVKVDQLREVLGVRKTEYQLFGDFKRRVIEKSRSELTQQSDLTFDYTVWKEGRAVAGLIFTIKENVPTGKPAKKKRGRPKKEESVIPSIDLFAELDGPDASGTYSEELTTKLERLGIRHLDTYAKEGLTEEHFLVSLEKHKDDLSTGKIIESAREELLRDKSSKGQMKKIEEEQSRIKKHKRWWEENKASFKDLIYNDAYLQSSKGYTIRWSDANFHEEVEKYMKPEEEVSSDDDRKTQRRAKKSLIRGSSLTPRGSDRRKVNRGKEFREPTEEEIERRKRDMQQRLKDAENLKS